jgi:hypothetical protein
MLGKREVEWNGMEIELVGLLIAPWRMALREMVGAYPSLNLNFRSLAFGKASSLQLERVIT